jgi:uncharacterized protein (TIGR03437 family)
MLAFFHMRLFTSVVFLLSASCAFSATPVITGVVNAASFAAGTLAAGSLGTIFGSDLAATTAVAGIPLPASLGSASVYVNDIAVPLLYVSPGQINFQVPWQAVPGPSTVLIINSNGISNYLTVQIAATAPGLFSGGVVASAWGEPTRAVHAGEYVTIYATGLGPVENPPPTGMSLPDAALATVRTTPTVTIGGMPATVAFAGLAPPGQNRYTVGVYQIDALVPSNAPAGDSVPVVVSTAGIGSNPVTVSIAAGASPSIAKYIELGPAGAVVARAITSENVCPLISIDGTSQPMQMRAAGSLPFYPVLSCEAAIPSGTKAVAIEGQALTLPINNPQRITVLGDTGCRMDTSNSQACSDPKAWPVATVAASALSTNPQLLIHDGDYHYREAQCSPSVPGCAGSPWGYNWDVWREDVFRPLQSLLPAAPWVFVRGNHESCDRAGEGWFRFSRSPPPAVGVPDLYRSLCCFTREPANHPSRFCGCRRRR